MLADLTIEQRSDREWNGTNWSRQKSSLSFCFDSDLEVVLCCRDVSGNCPNKLTQNQNSFKTQFIDTKNSSFQSKNLWPTL